MSEPVPIAIIGISCLFPKADDLQAYWSNIKNGVDAITPIPERTHWKIGDYFDPDPKAPDRTYACRGGFLPVIDFDPLEFGIPPKDIEATDTTQILGLVAAKKALQDAGYGSKPFNRDRTSVILGVTGALELVIPLGARLGHPIWRRALKEAGVDDTVADDVVQRIAGSYVNWQENSFPGLLGNVVAGRIANRLDLGGTNCVVDAACASSLGALHLGMLELSTGRSDMVITGGLDTFNDVFMYMCFSKTPALSPTGDAKPFDRDCDGTIIGEGLGIMVLKRLADAERDGDRIYAVVTGMGSSSDGHGNAIYAPRADGQKAALERAYAAAGVTPDTIELVEAHGTGTKVGDATELRALTEVFCAARSEGSWTALGSVKSQIGHTKAAAGVAGLIKAALALRSKVLPPTIKVNQPMEEVAPGRSPFYLNTQKRPWLPQEQHPRRAGVSSFGFGGTNFHCVLEEHGCQRPAVDWDGDVEILALSSGSLADLRDQVTGLPAASSWGELRALARRSRSEFRDGHAARLLLAITPGTNLTALRDSVLLMFDTHPEKTHWTLPAGVAFGSGERSGKLGALFPGQGSQYTGMLRDLACQFPEMLAALADADRVFARECSDRGAQRLSDFIYPHPAFTDEARRQQEEALKSTDIAQPALGAVSLGALKVMTSFGVALEAAAGHSYGELLALCGAGRLLPESLHLLSNVRGRLMANRNGHGDRGAMLAVQAPEEAVVQFVRESNSGLVIANRNSPGQFVLAGPKADIEQAAGEFAKRSIRTRLLPVSAAFHSALVADARDPFAAALEGIPFSGGHIPVYANTTAQVYPAGAAQTRDLLANQMVKPVDFMAQIQTMFQDGVATFIELGPGHVLSDLVQSILPGREVETVALDASRGARSGTFDLAVALCRLASLGHRVDLTRWEDSATEPSGKSAGKPSLTVPVCGANFRQTQPSRRPVPPVAPASQPSVNVVPDQRSLIAPDSISSAPAAPDAVPALEALALPKRELRADLASALEVAQQGMMALQKLQAQTAELHRQFLEGQEAARRSLESLLDSRRQFLGEAAYQPPSLSAAGQPPLPGKDSGPKAKPQISPSDRKEPPPTAPALAEDPSSAHRRPAPAGVAQAVLEVVAEKTGYPVEMLELTMGLDTDLGIDSIKRVEIMAALRGRLPEAPEVKPEHLGALRTLQEVAAFLGGPKENAAPPSQPPTSSDGRARVIEFVLQVVADKTGYPSEMLSLNMGLDSDLGIDSIKRVEIMAALRTQLPEAPEIKPEHLGTLQTLEQVVDFLADKPGVGPTHNPSTIFRASPSRGVAADGVQVSSKDATASGVPDLPEIPILEPPQDLHRQVVRAVRLTHANQPPAASWAANAHFWVTDDGSDLAARVESELRRRGHSVRRAIPSDLITNGRDESPAWSSCRRLPIAETLF